MFQKSDASRGPSALADRPTGRQTRTHHQGPLHSFLGRPHSKTRDPCLPRKLSSTRIYNGPNAANMCILFQTGTDTS
uniref:Uncharacterized protein n=1 Tax=Rhodococcus sp. NS1 TaxID=402236 RepID=A0A097SQ53_9NOCA|nr:hypothetical protein LRS1606.218 [Rhodococcus sp. NS1]